MLHSGRSWLPTRLLKWKSVLYVLYILLLYSIYSVQFYLLIPHPLLLGQCHIKSASPIPTQSAESQYSTFRCELLEAYLMVRHVHHFLVGCKCITYADLCHRVWHLKPFSCENCAALLSSQISSPACSTLLMRLTCHLVHIHWISTVSCLTTCFIWPSVSKDVVHWAWTCLTYQRAKIWCHMFCPTWTTDMPMWTTLPSCHSPYAHHIFVPTPSIKTHGRGPVHYALGPSDCISSCRDVAFGGPVVANEVGPISWLQPVSHALNSELALAS